MPTARFPRRLALACTLILSAAAMHAADIAIVDQGQARAVLVLPDAVMAPDAAVARRSPDWKAEADRRRLRDSVLDLVTYVRLMSGATLDVLAADPGDGRLPILVGDAATARFGAPAVTDRAGQGFRIVATPAAVGISGQSDLALSYALITLLHDWGCRWYIPGELGEVIPSQPTLTLAEQDRSDKPDTLYRGVWYADDAWKRRNRTGGLLINAGHFIEHAITDAQREEHPDWRAIVNGKPDKAKLKWTHPEVAKALADLIIARQAELPETSYSLSPMDGIGWDEELDPKSDAGDWDPVAGTVSKTDRLLVLCNRVAELVGQKYPDVLFGFLVYVDYTRPPVRETPHPALVPQIAPIVYQRAHPMTHFDHPNGRQLLDLVEGWAAKVDNISYYWYGYNLAEVSAPNPFLTKWGTDLPILMENHCQFWQPETMTNFETTAPALYMSMRLTFDKETQPEVVYDEFFTRFYGAAAAPMAAYWRHIDKAWISTPEYVGSGFGYLRIFTPEVMAEARAHMDAALAACQTIPEYRRVKMADDSLRQFERMLQIRHDLVDGRFASLDLRADAWRETAHTLEREYRVNYAFAGRNGPGTWHSAYFRFQWGNACDEAGRIAKDFTVDTRNPLRQWRWQRDPNMALPDAAKTPAQERQVLGTAEGWQQPGFDDSAWPVTDVGVESWSTLGMHDFQGDVWYRLTTKPPALRPGKKMYLWIPLMDGELTVYIDGKLVPYVDAKGEQKDSYTGYCKPYSLDVTAFVTPGQPCQVTVHARRAFLNELGTGGLMNPAFFYTEK